MHIFPFAGTNFWLATTIFQSIYLLTRIGQRSLLIKNSFMIAVSTSILFLAVKQSLILLPILLLLTLLVYWIGCVLSRTQKDPSGKGILLISIAVVTIVLCYFKYSFFQQYINQFTPLLMGAQPSPALPLNSHLFFIGVSYFSFKFIHFLVECYKKKIENPDIMTFINYILFFPSFFSGPINRYNTFATSIATITNNSTNLIPGIQRIINGLFKTIVIANTLQPYSTTALDIATASPSEIIISLYAFGLYAYFNFAGYTDMAIGCGKIVGIELPENFNKPFFQRNLQKFWSNWHMSLTSWLTDYIYWPLAKKLRKIKLLRKKPVTISNISIFFTFVICGIWHGDGLNFLLWGAFHGIGLMVLNGYTLVIRKYASRNVKKFVKKSPIAYAFSNFLTFQYVSLGFIAFTCNTKELQTILYRLLGS
jgi:alginate O-acetyltransferase complex protein AlgI